MLAIAKDEDLRRMGWHLIMQVRLTLSRACYMPSPSLGNGADNNGWPIPLSQSMAHWELIIPSQIVTE